MKNTFAFGSSKSQMLQSSFPASFLKVLPQKFNRFRFHIPVVNQHLYKEVLTHLVNKIRHKRRASWTRKTWILHKDNAPAYTALSVKQFLVLKEVTMLHHQPCCIIHLFFAGLSHLRFLSFSKAERDSQGDMLPRS